MDESWISAAAVHLSDSSGMSAAAAHTHESSDLSAPLPWCSSQCLRAKSARSLSVSIFDFVFFAFSFLFSRTARIFYACLDAGRKKISYSSRCTCLIFVFVLVSILFLDTHILLLVFIWVISLVVVYIVVEFSSCRFLVSQLDMSDAFMHFELSHTCAPCLSAFRSFAQLIPAAYLWRIHEKVSGLCWFLKKVLNGLFYHS